MRTSVHFNLYVFFMKSIKSLICILFMCNWAFAHEISSQGFWEDPTASADFSTARTQAYTPFRGVLSKGFTKSSFWIRVTIDPEQPTPAFRALGDRLEQRREDASKDLILRVRPNYLDLIELYDPELNTSLPVQSTGDMTQWNSTKPYQAIDHNLILRNVTQPKTVFLRFKTSSTSQIYVDCQTPSEFIVSSNTLSFVYSTTIALLFFFFVWIFVNWLLDKSTLNLLFVVKQGIFLSYTFCFFGYHRIYFNDVITPQELNSFYNVWIQITVVSSMWFESRFLKLHQAPQWSDILAKILVVWGCINIGLLFFDTTLHALFSNMLLTGFGIIMLFVSAFFIKGAPLENSVKNQIFVKKWIIVTYYCIITAVVMVFVIPGLGLSKLPTLNLYSVISYGLSSGILMTILLHIRTKNISQIRADDALALKLSIEQVESEKTKRKEQTEFLHMLMHELKTPLSVLDLALHSNSKSLKNQQYASRAIMDMKSIIERCIEADQMQENKLILKNETIHVVSLIEDILDTDELSKSRVQLECDVDSTVNSDFQFLRIILNNLIHNAVRYGHEDERVSIVISIDSTTHQQNHLYITIANKPGSASWPDPSRVFEKYYRSPGAQKQSGTGLGLFLVTNLCKRISALCLYDPTPTHIQFKLWIPS